MELTDTNPGIEFGVPILANGKFTVKCSTTQSGPTRECKVHIAVRDITTEQSDVIVHPTNGKLDFKGRVGHCLLKKAGYDFHKLCKAKGYLDTVCLTGSGQLSCKSVAHINVHKYTHKSEGTMRRFIDFLKRKLNLFEFTTLGWETTYLCCLQLVEENGYSSISIPILGSGKYGVPADISAAGFLQALALFMVSCQQNVKVIRIVTQDQHICNEFQNTVQQYCDFLEREKRRHKRGIQGNTPTDPKEIIKELHTLLNYKLTDVVGLQSMKDQLLQFSTTCALNMIRKQQGINVPRKVPVFLFTGNPGTGKTSIAAIIAEVLQATKLTKSKKLVTVQREDLVAQYVGQTAQKTKEVIDTARGATLLIDEVYRLVPQGPGGNDFGPEALDTIMGVIEGDANTTTDRPAIIFAGYPQDMKRVLDSNPGLRRRITHRFDFADYSVNEIVQIINKLASKDGYRITASNTALESKIRSSIRLDVLSQHNAGLSGRIYAAAKTEADKRLGGVITTGIVDLTRSVLVTLTDDDFNAAIDLVKVHL